ncbi:MAG: helix-hairpin-helix domain-containing protein [Planctomycetota bacterium]|nr:helix-hairpin-helix domain-containing protein [Planctomycetota bacterium]
MHPQRSDHVWIIVLVAIVLVLSAIHWIRLSGWGMVEVTIHHADTYEYRLNANTATWVEWSQFDGISPQLAREIVRHRERHGPFSSSDDLLRVSKLSTTQLAVIRPHLDFAAD